MSRVDIPCHPEAYSVMRKIYPTLVDNATAIQSLFPATTPTLADVAVLIQGHEGLSVTRKRDLVSALMRIAKALRLNPVDVPADPAWLQARLSHIVPAQLGIAAKTWSNVVSDGLAALNGAGVVPKYFRRLELAEPWQILWSRLDGQPWRGPLGPFFRFCSNNDLQPYDVTNDTLAQYEVALTSASLRKRPDLAIYQVTLSWNRACSIIPGWPSIKLSLPSRRIVIMPAGMTLSQAFQRDLERYVNAGVILQHFSGAKVQQWCKQKGPRSGAFLLVAF